MPDGKSVMTSVKDRPLKNVKNLVEAPSIICGAALGTLFIPFSYIYPENAWYYDWISHRQHWACEAAPDLPKKRIHPDAILPYEGT